jgi:hypothetical protein
MRYTCLNPAATALWATWRITPRKTSELRLTVPGNRMCPVFSTASPAGEYGITG